MKQERTRAEWRELITQQEESGLPALTWCEAHGISGNGFYAARRRIYGGAKDRSPIHWTPVRVVDKGPVSATLPVPAAVSATPPSMLVLEFGDRYRLHIPADMDPDRLRQVLEVLVP
ncbi:MAG: hypothetical protein QM296_10575 [Bacillota bacterium]|nr:hypothetical protein [Bacillota bacterium]